MSFKHSLHFAVLPSSDGVKYFHTKLLVEDIMRDLDQPIVMKREYTE